MGKQEQEGKASKDQLRDSQVSDGTRLVRRGIFFSYKTHLIEDSQGLGKLFRGDHPMT